MEKQTKVYLDPRNRLHYSAFYIQGLWDCFGKSNIFYSLIPFLSLDRKDEIQSFDHYMAMVIYRQNEYIKIIIDFRDMTDITDSVYHWANVYAKVNISRDMDRSKYPKLMSIPPGFGIKIYNWAESVFYCIANYFRCDGQCLETIPGHIFDYISTHRFARINEYEKRNQEVPNYVFLASTLWYHKNCVQTTNPLRLAFMKTCTTLPQIQFEGGFFVHGEAPKEYKSYALKHWIKRSKYMSKIKQSEIVFNTPSVYNCHGWKLGEYLAMGKAIITTPISNMLPQELKNKQHVYIINTADEMADAVQTLLQNKTLLKQFRANTVAYYDEFVKPSQVIKNILKFYQNSKLKTYDS